MTNFRIISSALVLLAAVLTSACKAGFFIITNDGSGPSSGMSYVPLAGLASPGKVGWFINTRDDDASTIDSLISSNIHELSYEEGFRVIGYNCIELLCRNSETEDLHDLASSKFRLWDGNGKINGPEKNAADFSQGLGGFVISYTYLMRNSLFWVANTKDSSSGYEHKAVYVAGNSSRSRPSGNATYTGKVIAISTGDVFTEREDLHFGDFHLTYDSRDNTMKIDIDFDDRNYSLKPNHVSSKGKFSRTITNGADLKDDFFSSDLRGGFFGSNHGEVAGTFELLSEKVIVTFGGLKD